MSPRKASLGLTLLLTMLTLPAWAAAPVILGVDQPIIGTAGTALSYQIQATNNPVFYSATPLPAGLSINSQTGLISGNTQNPGVVTLTLTASNQPPGNQNETNTGTATIQLVIRALPPTITNALEVKSSLGRTVSFPLTATGFPAPVFTVSALPPGLKIENNLIRGIPLQSTVINVTLAATNSGPLASGGTDVKTLIINITAPSQITSPLIIPGVVGEAIDYRIAGTDQPFQFGLSPMTIAGGITIDNQGIQTGFLSGAPTQAGRFAGVVTAVNTINYDVTDPCTFNQAIATGQAQVVFAIATVPGAPAITSADALECTEAVPFQYGIIAINGPTQFDMTDTAAVGDENIPGFADPLPPGLTLDAATGLIQGIPTITAAPVFDTPQDYNVTIRARNGFGFGRAAFTITVLPARPDIEQLAEGKVLAAEIMQLFQYNVRTTFYPPESGVTNLTFDVTNALDVNGNPNFSIEGVPAAFSRNIIIHPTTGKLSGTPDTGDTGQYTIFVRATNSEGSDIQSFTLFIGLGVDEDDFFVELPGQLNAVVNCPFEFQLPGDGAPWSMTTSIGAGFTGLNAADVNLVIETGTGIISGSPAITSLTMAQNSATYRLGITASTLFDAPITLTVSRTAPIPVRPTIDLPTFVTAIVGQAVEEPVTLNEDYTNPANGLPPLIFSGGPLPVGTSLQSAAFKSTINAVGDPIVRIVGIPLEPGTTTGAIGVINATGSDKKNVTFTVAPVQIYSPLTATGTVGRPFFTLDVIAPITAGPADDDTSYFIRATGSTNEYGAANLPPGLSINPQTGEISGIPVNTGSATNVVTNVTITASNTFSTDTKTLVITIQPKPANAPTIDATGLTASIFDGVEYTVAAPVFDVNAAGGLGTTVYRAIGLPQGLTINPQSGVITGTTSQLGLFNVTVLATADQNTPLNPADDLADARILALTVLAVPPVIDTTNLTFSTPVNVQFSAPILVSGTIPISLTAAPGTLPPGVVLTNQALSGIPTQEGVYTIPITASGPGGSDNANFVLSVTRTPTIQGKIPMTNNIIVPGVVGLPFSYTVTSVGFEPPVFTITPADTAALAAVGLSFDGTTVSGTPTDERPAGLTITITATNSTGSDTVNLIIQIRGVEITSPLVVGGAVGQAFSYTITATGNPTTFTATNLPAGLSFSGNSITGVPIAPGQTRVEITAANGLSSASATLVIAISTTPGAPAISSALLASGVLNTPFLYAITATNSPTSYSATGLPAGLTLSPSVGLITGSPTTTGSFNVTITATNSVGSGSAQLVVAIAAVTGGTAITSPLTATAVQGQAFSYQITSIGTPIITFGAGGLPTGLTADSTTGVISGIPTVAGTFPILLQATNFTTATAILQLTVVSQGAVISSPTTVGSPVGQAFSYIITATGVTPITFSITGTLPSGLSFDPATAAITGVPTVEGVTTVTMTASNPFGTDNKSLTITIGPRAPLISSALAVSGQTNVPFSYQITAGGSTPITFGASSLPPGLSVDANGLISGTPTQIGTFNVTLNASNVIGSDTKTLVVTITEALDDFDQDGFPNELEIAFGSDPQNPNSTPFGGANVTDRGILSLGTVKIKLTFSSVGRDSVSQKGSFQLPAGYVLTNKNATVVVGGFLANLGALTDKGNAAVGTNKLSIKVSKKNAPAKYSLTLKGDLKGSFTDEGLTNDNIDKKLNATRTVRTFLLLDNTGTTPLLFENSKQLLYTSKQGKTGQASGK